MKPEFKECDTCAALPGTPPLCSGCLHNRNVITYFRVTRVIGRLPAPDFEKWLLDRSER